MSRTAVIVSGSLRHLVNASSSWCIPGDYYLIVDQDIQASQGSDLVGNSFVELADNLKKCHVKFISVTVSVDSTLPEEFRKNSSANMIAKWRLALHQITAYSHLGYDKVVVLRPDIYIRKKTPTIKFDEAVLNDNIIYSTVNITPVNGKLLPIMNDVLLMFNVQTYTRFVNELYWFYLEKNSQLVSEGHDIHSLMASFVKDRNFEVDNFLDKFFEFTILRDNSIDMFDQGVLQPTHSFNDVIQRGVKWWGQRYE
jgi:hypothetical protein